LKNLKKISNYKENKNRIMESGILVRIKNEEGEKEFETRVLPPGDKKIYLGIKLKYLTGEEINRSISMGYDIGAGKFYIPIGIIETEGEIVSGGEKGESVKSPYKTRLGRVKRVIKNPKKVNIKIDGWKPVCDGIEQIVIEIYEQMYLSI